MEDEKPKSQDENICTYEVPEDGILLKMIVKYI